MTARLLQLYALKSMVDALIVAEEAELGVHSQQVPEGACPNCGAPESQQKASGNLAEGPKLFCLSCKQERPA